MHLKYIMHIHNIIYNYNIFTSDHALQQYVNRILYCVKPTTNFNSTYYCLQRNDLLQPTQCSDK